MYLNESISSHLERCEKRTAMLNEKISSLPAGKIQSYVNGNYRSWRFVDEEGKKHYMSKNNFELARLLALKRIYMAELHDLEAEAEACRRYLRCKDRSKHMLDQELLTMPPDLRKLVGESFKTSDERIAAWENTPYEKYDQYPENLIHPTLKEDLMVRSKIEADMANNLFILKIPFKYEKMTVIGNNKFAPDFTALDVRTFQEILIEVFGMMDKPEYRKQYIKKMTEYINCGYIPGINLLTFYEFSTAPLNPLLIRESLEDFFFKNPPIQI